MELQTFLIEGAMISLDKAVLLRVMWIADDHGDSQAVTKALRPRRESHCLEVTPPSACPGPK
jgi:hypothetical protein